MPEISLASATTIGAVLAFVLAASAGITSRQGIRLVLIGIMLSLTSDVSRAVAGLAAKERVRRAHEQHETRTVQSCNRGS
jgi:hypothetical protein